MDRPRFLVAGAPTDAGRNATPVALEAVVTQYSGPPTSPALSADSIRKSPARGCNLQHSTSDCQT